MAERKLIRQQWFTGQEDETEYLGNIDCQCGERVWLHLNGGELDREECKCGRIYYTETPLIQTWMVDSGKCGHTLKIDTINISCDRERGHSTNHGNQEITWPTT